jgi:hypothetical protein
MIKQDLDISIRQIDDMKHCIGFNQNKVKSNKYYAWRNYFITTNHDESWDNLVISGLAVKRDFKMGAGPNPQCYSISKDGFKFLEENLGVKIIISK